MGQTDDFDAVIHEVDDDSTQKEALVNSLAGRLFRKNCLDRRLKRHHITGKRIGTLLVSIDAVDATSQALHSRGQLA